MGEWENINKQMKSRAGDSRGLEPLILTAYIPGGKDTSNSYSESPGTHMTI